MDEPQNLSIPLPLFDTMDRVSEIDVTSISNNHFFTLSDYQRALAFIKSYDGSEGTFNAYRREVERLLHWSWQVAKKSVCTLTRVDIEVYLRFCQKPPRVWIGLKKVPRFILRDGVRSANPEWRPFVVSLPKRSIRAGQKLEVNLYALSETALREIFAILSSFYNFLIQEESTEINPVAQIRQKSKFLRKRQGKAKIRRLSNRQWEYVIETVFFMAEHDPKKHERTLFILSVLYLMYLRISELAASSRWTPRMNDFHCDQDGQWWFTVVGKGNKERDIAVSDSMLEALKRWRKYLQLSPLPSPADQTPLLPKVKGQGAVGNTSFLRKIVQNCFDQAIDRLNEDGHVDDAQALAEATVHWLRHTGISDDVKVRPREHVRDDAGHSSGAITDRYIDIERSERHASAKRKTLKPV